MTDRRHHALAWFAGLLLLFLHLDFWREADNSFYGGWISGELGYRLIWMLLAWLYLLYFCSWIWRDT
ncbi:MAG TPA: hypothetical protein EYN66_19460, partial [Myxococcales bacterium]|nr:hypothetical protein [Myxococcales bacterium]